MAIQITVPNDFRFQLPGGDNIELEIGQGSDPNNIEFCLQAGGRIYWWKGVVLVYNNGSYRTIADIAERPNEEQCGLLSHADLTAQGVNGLHLSKAGFWGIHDNTYRIQNAGSVFSNGQRIIFRWLKD